MLIEVSSHKLEPRISLNDIQTFNLLALPFLAFRIEGGVDETTPVFVITDWEIGTIVESGVTGLFPEFHVPDVGLNTPDAVVVLPATEELMEIASGHLLGILTEKLEQVEADVEQFTGGHVVSGYTTAVFIS
jgi:hypothetical protein